MQCPQGDAHVLTGPDLTMSPYAQPLFVPHCPGPSLVRGTVWFEALVQSLACGVKLTLSPTTHSRATLQPPHPLMGGYDEYQLAHSAVEL